MRDSKKTKPYTNEVMQYGDEVMSLEYTNGKWDEINKTILVYELISKGNSLETDPDAKKFYWAMRTRRDYLSKLIEKKRLSPKKN